MGDSGKGGKGGSKGERKGGEREERGGERGIKEMKVKRGRSSLLEDIHSFACSCFHAK